MVAIEDSAGGSGAGPKFDIGAAPDGGVAGCDTMQGGAALLQRERGVAVGARVADVELVVAAQAGALVREPAEGALGDVHGATVVSFGAGSPPSPRA